LSYLTPQKTEGIRARALNKTKIMSWMIVVVCRLEQSIGNLSLKARLVKDLLRKITGFKRQIRSRLL